jgi:hypothetical protein
VLLVTGFLVWDVVVGRWSDVPYDLAVIVAASWAVRWSHRKSRLADRSLSA